MVVLGDAGRFGILMAVPWILHVHVLRGMQPGGLPMRGHLHARERGVVEPGRGEQRRDVADPIGTIACAVRETPVRSGLDPHPPLAVQALRRIHAGIRAHQTAGVVGMRREPVHRVHTRVGEPCRRRHGWGDDRSPVLLQVVGCVHDVLAFASDDCVASLPPHFGNRAEGDSLHNKDKVIYLITQILLRVSKKNEPMP